MLVTERSENPVTDEKVKLGNIQKWLFPFFIGGSAPKPPRLFLTSKKAGIFRGLKQPVPPLGGGGGLKVFIWLNCVFYDDTIYKF